MIPYPKMVKRSDSRFPGIGIDPALDRIFGKKDGPLVASTRLRGKSVITQPRTQLFDHLNLYFPCERLIMTARPSIPQMRKGATDPAHASHPRRGARRLHVAREPAWARRPDGVGGGDGDGDCDGPWYEHSRAPGLRRGKLPRGEWWAQSRAIDFYPKIRLI